MVKKSQEKKENSTQTNIDWHARIISICNFCKNYNAQKPIKTGESAAIVLIKRLEIIANFIFGDLDTTKFESNVSKGSGVMPKAPWIAINLKGKKVSNSISFVICFARSGEGIVLGLMSPSGFKMSDQLIKRSLNQNNIVIDKNSKNKYDDKFINPIEMHVKDIDIKALLTHKDNSCALLEKQYNSL